MLTLIFIFSISVFIIAFFVYGRYIDKVFDVNDSKRTPAHSQNDGIDHVPSKAIILFGHHFASISGAGPIVGPILAGLAFGWVPAILWIVIGSIFIGGVHDFSSIIASIRHKAKSVAEIAREYVSRKAFKIFLIFIWLALVYVLIVFFDLTAATFSNIEKGGGSVATASIFFIGLAVLLGISLYRLKFKLAPMTIIFIILIFAGIYCGIRYPLIINTELFPSWLTGKDIWCIILIIYAFIASTISVCILLQPRDYLSSFLLYSAVLGGFIGIVFGGMEITYPAFIAFKSGSNGLFPYLFIMIACGAVSGFHSIVSSGTTSKQLYRESDARKVGYGGMLTEAVVAIIALATIMIVSKGSNTGQSGLVIFSKGIGKFLGVIGIPLKYGQTFGSLVLSTFLLTTLDTATRLARYILQEFFDWDIKKSRFNATIITLILPIYSVILLPVFQRVRGIEIAPVWKVIWPVFGATNQLLAAVTLLIITVWLIKMKKNSLFVVLPMIFMFIVTLYALILLIVNNGLSLVGIIACILFILAIYLIFESVVAINKSRKSV